MSPETLLKIERMHEKLLADMRSYGSKLRQDLTGVMERTAMPFDEVFARVKALEEEVKRLSKLKSECTPGERRALNAAFSALPALMDVDRLAVGIKDPQLETIRILVDALRAAIKGA